MPPSRTDTSGSSSASTRCWARRPHESGRDPPDPALSVAGLAAPAGEHVQVPPELLRLRDPRDSQARRASGCAAGGVAAPAVQPLVARGSGLPVIVVASILSPLENLMKSILDFFHGSIGLPWAWSIVALTVLVRIVLVPLTVRQIHSMQSLQAH